MTTATPPEAHDRAPIETVDPERPLPIDPAHDFDAKTTTRWLVISTVFVFVTIALLMQLFTWVIHNERVRVVEEAPTRQLDELRKLELEELGPGEGRKSLEQAIDDYLK